MPTLFRKYYPLRTIVFVLGEGALIFLSLMIVDWFMLDPGLFLVDLVSNVARACSGYRYLSTLPLFL